MVLEGSGENLHAPTLEKGSRRALHTLVPRCDEGNTWSGLTSPLQDFMPSHFSRSEKPLLDLRQDAALDLHDHGHGPMVFIISSHQWTVERPRAKIREYTQQRQFETLIRRAAKHIFP